MNHATSSPLLVPIGAVVEALHAEFPDVSQSSLRFLEREGLIAPPRTPGGHRLFAPADIQRVRRIKEWQTQGLSLDVIRRRLARLDALDAPRDLAVRFLRLALEGNLPSARRTILELSDLGIPLDVLFMHVLRPALWELGDGWHRGDVSVAQEKEVTELARELIADLTLRYARDEATHGTQIVAACVAGERHDLGLRMVCGLLRERGLRVHFLGADVASSFLTDAVQRRHPRAVLLSATDDAHLPAIKVAVDAVRAAGLSPIMLAGGQAVVRAAALVDSWGVLPVTDEAGSVGAILEQANA